VIKVFRGAEDEITGIEDGDDEFLFLTISVLRN
jgi:hypothetical protein